MKTLEAMMLADHYGGDQVFGDERDQMSSALMVLVEEVRRLCRERDTVQRRINLAIPLLAAHFENLNMDTPDDQATANEAWALVRAVLEGRDT